MNPLDAGLTRHWFGREHHQTRIAYTSANLPEYIGLSERGTASSDAKWWIVKMTYDSNNMVTLRQSSARDQIWDNRDSISYG